MGGSLLGLIESVGGLLRSVCPFSVTVGRHFTPGSVRVDAVQRCTCIAWDRSLLGLPLSVSADVSQREQVLHDDASNMPLLSLSIATCSVVWHRLARC